MTQAPEFSKACCSLPPVQAKDYQPKGHYETICDLKTYVTGPEDATEAVLVGYDIFAFTPQIVQGADVLSANRYRVFMPDFFQGRSVTAAFFSMSEEDRVSVITAFVKKEGNLDLAVSRVPRFVEAVGSQFKKWAILGHCWGGKLAALSSSAVANASKRFSVSLQFHPGLLNGEDAKHMNIPHLLLASKDEPSAQVEAYKTELAANENTAGDKHAVKVFDKQSHGWMSARADLTNDDDRDAYARGYQTALGFLKKHLSNETCPA